MLHRRRHHVCIRVSHCPVCYPFRYCLQPVMASPGNAFLGRRCTILVLRSPFGLPQDRGHPMGAAQAGSRSDKGTPKRLPLSQPGQPALPASRAPLCKGLDHRELCSPFVSHPGLHRPDCTLNLARRLVPTQRRT